MTLTSTLGSPGIEIREVDNSFRLDSNTATTVFIPGFASQGPVDEVMSVGTMTDFETIYGVPTNAAERYFYYTVKAILDNSGNSVTVLCSRLPYGSGPGDNISNAYTMLAYPAIPVIKQKHSDTNNEYGLNDGFKIDFDQFLFKTASKNELVKAFIAKKPNSEETKTPVIDEIILTVDDDKISQNTLTITHIGTSTIPSNIATVYDNNGEFNTKLSAPKITFDGNIEAQGLIASEDKDGSCFVHLSYTLTKGTTDKCGSLYIKLKYDSTEIDEWNTSGLSSTSITAEFKEAFQIAESFQGKATTDGADEKDYSDEVTYVVGSPVTYQVSLSEYYKIITGETIKWSRKPYNFGDQTKSTTIYENDDDEIGTEGTFGNFDALGHSAFIVINTSRTIINNNFEGFYLGITDNMFVTPSDDYTFNAVENVKITTDFYDQIDDEKLGLIDRIDDTGNFQTLSGNRLSFYLNSNSQGSISRVLTRNITSMDISGTEYDDTINMGLFKLTKSTDSQDILKLNYSLREKYNWSFGKTRLKSVAGTTVPVSYFVENVVEDSNNLTVIMNPYIAKKAFIDTDGVIHGKMRILGNKLLGNLEWFEQKYLLRDYQSLSQNTKYSNKNISALVPAMLAKSSINSWISMVKQAGITPKFIKKNFKNITDNLETSTSNYYNFHPLNSIIPFGTYTASGNDNKFIGELPAKLERALALVENDEQYPDIDLVLESGLGTIYMYSEAESVISESIGAGVILGEQGGELDAEDEAREAIFDENIILNGIEDLRTGRTSLSEDAQDALENYLAVNSVFTQFANSMQNGGRGDTFYISDIPRGILIKGKNTKVTNLYGSPIENNAYDFGESVNHSFPTSVYYPIKHIFDSVVSSYMSTYAQWVKVLDVYSSEKVWIPISGYIVANMGATDATYGPWYAAAGMRRGVINGVLDYAISPSVTQRSDLYKICINSVPKIPNYGVTIWGIRTMSKKDSAFDQNTCRRTFLYMEKKVKQAMRYYIFEPNTSYTRLQIYNELYPFLERIKNAGGIYSYTLVCDTTNNTPDIINNGDLAVSIAAAPTRTAENIIVEFKANKYTDEVTASEYMN